MSILKTITLALALATAGLAAAPALAQDPWAGVPASLSTGQFYWHDVPGDGPVSIVVSVSQQMAYVYRGETVIGASTVSTGKPGHETPTGSFTILQKDVDHHSSLYDDAAMPFMQRLTWDGVALHAGKVMDHPASHGCVRLPLAFARKLYGVTGLGASVVITDEDSGPPADAPATDMVGVQTAEASQ